MAARHNAKKVSAKAPKKTVVPFKKAAEKAMPKAVKKVAKKAAKKTAAKAPAKSRRPEAERPKQAAKAVTKAPAKKTAAAAPIKGLKGIQGGKAARIAQIVAESFLPASGATHAAPGKAAAEAASNDVVRVAHRIATELFSKKAEDVVLMDLRNLSTVADYYLIATCRNEPQMRAILGSVQRVLSREGVRSLRSEYMPGARWAVVDFGDIILHLFEKQTRGFYSLERLWADAPSTTLRAEDHVSADDGEVEDKAGANGATGFHDDL
jgi:ribosome-associated protein